MWFRNLKVFRLTPHWADHIETMGEALKSHAFAGSDDLSATAQGWVAPRENDDRLAVPVQGQYLLALRLEKKLLPATVINQETKARALLLEAEQGYKPGRKQLKDLKQSVTDELMPRAFRIARDIGVWVDPVNRWLVVDAASSGQAEEVLSALGKSMHPYPVEPIQLSHSVTGLMTNWMIAGQAPDGFGLDPESQWQSTGDSAGVIRYVRHELSNEAITRHVQAGYQCTRLALTWQDRISFVLTETADCKRVNALDILQERANAESGTTPEDKLDSDFMLMTAELNQLLIALTEALGASDTNNSNDAKQASEGAQAT